jgi:hypothetical protein
MEDRVHRQANQSGKSIFDDGEALIRSATAALKKGCQSCRG